MEVLIKLMSQTEDLKVLKNRKSESSSGHALRVLECSIKM